MKTIDSIPAMQTTALKWRQKGMSVGFVPTMGALHEGHLSLVRRARDENDIVVASIFVNPLQFGPKEDFKKYPRMMARDMKLLSANHVDILFAPSASEIYPDGFATVVDVPALTQSLCGPFRPG